jgi:hypothetical protein
MPTDPTRTDAAAQVAQQPAEVGREPADGPAIQSEIPTAEAEPVLADKVEAGAPAEADTAEVEMTTVGDVIEIVADKDDGELRLVVGGSDAAELGYDKTAAEKRARSALERVLTAEDADPGRVRAWFNRWRADSGG